MQGNSYKNTDIESSQIILSAFFLI